MIRRAGRLRPAVLVALLAAVAAASACGALLASSGRAPPAVTLFVDRNSIGGSCDDARAASAAEDPRTPWCTLGRAAGAAPGGAVVLVRRGRYPRLRIEGRRGEHRTTIRPYARERVVVRGVTVHDSSRWRLERLRVTDVSMLEPAPGGESRDAVLDRIEFVRNDFSPHGLVIGRSTRLLFERNRVHDIRMDLVPNGTGGCHGDKRGSRARPPRCGYGIRLSRSTGAVVRGNRFERIPADGLQLASVADMTIEGNTFRRIEPFIDPHEHCDGIQLLGGSSEVVVAANTFDQGRGHHGIIVESLPAGHEFAGYTDGLRIENNVFRGAFGMNLYNVQDLAVVNNTAWTVSKGLALRELPRPGDLRDAVVLNNVLQHFEAGRGMVGRTGRNLILRGPRGRSDLTGDPRLVRPEAGDFRPRPGSPAIDAGDPRGAPATDRDGGARDDRPDVGAYEYR